MYNVKYITCIYFVYIKNKSAIFYSTFPVTLSQTGFGGRDSIFYLLYYNPRNAVTPVHRRFSYFLVVFPTFLHFSCYKVEES